MKTKKLRYIDMLLKEPLMGTYLWQIQEQKLLYIPQVMSGKNISQSCDDTDETVLTAAEVKAIATDKSITFREDEFG